MRISRGIRLWLLVVCFSLNTAVARAEDPDIVVVGWFDHFTYGLVNTAIGIPVALTGMIYNAIRNGQAPHIAIDDTGQQVRISTASVNYFNYSTGAIHHGEGAPDDHEAAHGKQSAVLGPAYLPVVGMTYLLQGLDVGVIEDWADAWRDLGSTMSNSHPARIEFEVRSRDGDTTSRVGLNFVVLERASRVNVGSGDNPTEVVYKYGNIGIYLMVPTAPAEAALVGGPAPGNDSIFPARVTGSLLEKDFNAKWTVVGGIFSVLADSKEKTLGVSWDITDHRLQAQILSQTLGFGVRIGDETKIALDVMGRGSMALEGLWFTGMGGNAISPSPGVMVTAGVGAEARLHLLQYLQLFARKTKEWALGGSYVRDVEVIGANTPVTFTSDTFTKKGRGGKAGGKALPWYLGAEFKHEVETWAYDGAENKSDIKSFFFTLGGRW